MNPSKHAQNFETSHLGVINLLYKSKSYTIHQTQLCYFIYIQLHVLVINDNHQAINTIFYS